MNISDNDKCMLEFFSVFQWREEFVSSISLSVKSSNAVLMFGRERQKHPFHNWYNGKIAEWTCFAKIPKQQVKVDVHHHGWWQSTLQNIRGCDPSGQLPQNQWRSNGDLNFPAGTDSAKLLPGAKSCHALASQSKGLQNDINVLLFSDHGMTDISWADKVIELKNHIDMSDIIQMKDRGPVVSLWPNPEKHEEVSTA